MKAAKKRARDRRKSDVIATPKRRSARGKKTSLDSRLRGNDKPRSALSTQHSALKKRSVLSTQSSAFKVRASYEAASSGRRLRLWQPGMIGPNDAVLRDLTQLRDRSRDLVRNNPWISRGISSWVANEIGCGITFKAQTPDQELNKRADDLWDRHDVLLDRHVLNLGLRRG